MLERNIINTFLCKQRNIKNPGKEIIAPPDENYWVIVPSATSYVEEQEEFKRYDVRLSSDGPQIGQIHAKTNGQIFVQTLADINVKTESDMHFTTPSIIYIDGEEKVHLNLPGPGASDATTSIVSKVATARTGLATQDLPVFGNPNTDATNEWSAYTWYEAPLTYDIMKRVPTHEPWVNHENINTPDSEKQATDREK